MKYKFLEHRADAKFQAFGKSLEEAFENSALALTSIMINPKKIKPTRTQKISIKGIDLKSLLYNFLEELLFLLETKSFLLNKIKTLKIEKNKLTATLIGDNKLEDYQISTHIKAITYNEMFIKEKPFKIQVVVDI